MTSPALLGLSGYARAGKDTVASILVEDHGYQAIAFADLLRTCVQTLNPIVGLDVDGDYVRYCEALEVFGYEGAKESAYGDEFRVILQRMGTEVGRKLLGQNIWVEATINSLEPGVKYVITDCRFPNEAQAVAERGGVVVRVNRPGFGPANAHPSETSLDDWAFDVILDNAGSLTDLRTKVAGNLRYLSLRNSR